MRVPSRALLSQLAAPLAHRVGRPVVRRVPDSCPESVCRVPDSCPKLLDSALESSNLGVESCCLCYPEGSTRANSALESSTLGVESSTLVARVGHVRLLDSGN